MCTPVRVDGRLYGVSQRHVVKASRIELQTLEARHAKALELQKEQEARIAQLEGEKEAREWRQIIFLAFGAKRWRLLQSGTPCLDMF